MFHFIKSKNRPMRLSASFNFFDGAELFLSAIENIRNEVDHISVLYQITSNYGNPIPQESLDVLQELKIRKLVDDFWLYEPNLTKLGGQNETIKRNKGIEIAKKANCNYLMMIDADEFYKPMELKQAKRQIVENDWDFTAVHIYDYYMHPTWRIKYPVNQFYCPFICKITPNTLHDRTDNYPIKVTDAARRLYVRNGSYRIFNTDIISLHHMTGVRKNGYEDKISNASYNDVESDVNNKRMVYKWMSKNLKPGILKLPDEIKRIVDEHQYLPKGKDFEIIETEDFFNLLHLF